MQTLQSVFAWNNIWIRNVGSSHCLSNLIGSMCIVRKWEIINFMPDPSPSYGEYISSKKCKIDVFFPESSSLYQNMGQ